MSRLSTAAALAAVAALAAAGTVQAAPPKPIEKTYTATAPLPDPTNNVAAAHEVCNMMVPQSFHIEKFEAKAPGTLKVVIGGFVGDWDFLIQDPKGADVAAATAIDTGTPVVEDTDTASVKIKKPGSYSLIACNFAGGPTATVKYTFTFAK